MPLAAILIYNYSVDWVIAAWVAAPYSFCFGGVGLAILGYALILIVMAVRASAWPVTRGRIVSAGVDRISS